MIYFNLKLISWLPIEILKTNISTTSFLTFGKFTTILTFQLQKGIVTVFVNEAINQVSTRAVYNQNWREIVVHMTQAMLCYAVDEKNHQTKSKKKCMRVLEH